MKVIQKIGAVAFLCMVIISSVSAQNRYFDERYVLTFLFQSGIGQPGAVAQHGGQQLMVNYRNTWSTFPGGPKTVTFLMMVCWK